MSISYSKQLLRPDSVLLNCLGRNLAFEIAIGVNGVVWIRSSDCLQSVVIRSSYALADTMNDNINSSLFLYRNAIINAQQMKDDFQIEAMVEKLVIRLRKHDR